MPELEHSFVLDVANATHNTPAFTRRRRLPQTRGPHFPVRIIQEHVGIPQQGTVVFRFLSTPKNRSSTMLLPSTIGMLCVQIVADCNEGARKMERMEEMLRLSQQIDFKVCKVISPLFIFVMANFEGSGRLSGK